MRSSCVTFPTGSPRGNTPSVPEVTSTSPSIMSSVRSAYSSLQASGLPRPRTLARARVRSTRTAMELLRSVSDEDVRAVRRDRVHPADHAVGDHHRHHPRDAVLGAAVDGEELEPHGPEPHADDARADVAALRRGLGEREQPAQPLGLGAVGEELLPLELERRARGPRGSTRALVRSAQRDVAAPRAEHARDRPADRPLDGRRAATRSARSRRERSGGRFACAKKTPSGTRSRTATRISSRYRLSNASTEDSAGAKFPCILALC